eukprot:g16417.t1
MSSKRELNEGESPPSEQETLPPPQKMRGRKQKQIPTLPPKKGAEKRKKRRGWRVGQSQSSTNITLGCMGSCPLRPFSLIWRSEPHSLSGKLLPDAQTYPDLLRKMIKENRAKEQKERKRREDEGLAEERVVRERANIRRYEKDEEERDEIHKTKVQKALGRKKQRFGPLEDPRWKSSSIQLVEVPANVLLAGQIPKS